ncbi:LOW QUALITY PROTEIN: protein mono-ADP-ribosyltransferase PARP10 [Choloepus didactylus]|uniref:LOW QUALITY PROTEIN: protein mono-ADP-ribosyltransferase PARP10 n=1 Tax=Choloepus didactylus TaxID=27675 RepID=UPI0018A0CD8A|nr:LOW QUALITY PROTEIN: protein mono-ADP-ribosyltransferase PARP10 [Choloepus didactylus]
MADAEAGGAVELRGLPPDVPDELLTLYFENRRRSGGGPVSSWQRLGRGGVLTFRERADARRVLAQGTHVLQRARLSLRPAPPWAPARLLLQGLPLGLTPQRLEQHVQALLRAAGRPELPCRALASPRPDRALVQLSEPLSAADVGALEQQARALGLEGAVVSLARVPQARAVRVVGGPHPADPLLLELYLENERRSGGGPLESLCSLPGDLGTVVNFQQWQVAERVLQWDHWLQGAQLSLVPHYDALEPEELAADSVEGGCLAEQGPGASEDVLLEAGGPTRARKGTGTAESVVAQGQSGTSLRTGPMGLLEQGGTASLRPEASPGQEGLVSPEPVGSPEQAEPMILEPVGSPEQAEPVGSPGQAEPVILEPMGSPEQAEPMILEPVGSPGQVGSVILEPVGSPGPAGSVILEPVGSPGQVGSVILEPVGSPGQAGSVILESVGSPGQAGPVILESVGSPGQAGPVILEPVGSPAQVGPVILEPVGSPGQVGSVILEPVGSPGQAGPVALEPVEMVLSMEPGALRFMQLYHGDLLASLEDIDLFPLEGTDVTGFQLRGALASCQAAEEFLRSLLGSISRHVLNLKLPGSAGFLLGPEGQHLLQELEAQFQCVFGTEWLARAALDTDPGEVDPTEALQALPGQDCTPWPPHSDQEAMSLEEVRELLATLEGPDSGEQLPLELEEEPEEGASPGGLEEASQQPLEGGPVAPGTGATPLEEEAALQLALHWSLEPRGQAAEQEEVAALQRALALSLLEQPLKEAEEPPGGGAQLVVHVAFEQDLGEVDRALGAALEGQLQEETVGIQGHMLPTGLQAQLEQCHGVSVALRGDRAVLRGFGAQPTRAARHLAALLTHPQDWKLAWPLAVAAPACAQQRTVGPLSGLECLAEGSSEFQEVVRAFCDSLDAAHSRVRVVRVERVSTPLLQQQYELHRQRMEQRCDRRPVEQVLYHGTSASAVRDICAHGFNRSFCGRNGTLYGQGVYFARRASLSVQDRYSPPDAGGHKAVFVARVLTGDYVLGRRDLRCPPCGTPASARSATTAPWTASASPASSSSSTTPRRCPPTSSPARTGCRLPPGTSPGARTTPRPPDPGDPRPSLPFPARAAVRSEARGLPRLVPGRPDHQGSAEPGRRVGAGLRPGTRPSAALV